MSMILLGKRANKPVEGQLYTIGGRMRKNESSEMTATRILAEEANITLPKAMYFVGHIEETFPDSRYEDVSTQCINLYFVLILDEDKAIAPDNQHKELVWYPIDSAQSLNPFVQQKIKQSLSYLQVNNLS